MPMFSNTEATQFIYIISKQIQITLCQPVLTSFI